MANSPCPLAVCWFSCNSNPSCIQGRKTEYRTFNSFAHRGTDTFLFLLVTLFLMQRRMLLASMVTWAHCWLMFSQHLQVLFCQVTFQPIFLKPTLLYGVVMTQVLHLAVSLMNVMSQHAAHQFRLFRSLCRTFLPSNRLTLCLQSYQGCTQFPSRLLIKTLNNSNKKRAVIKLNCTQNLGHKIGGTVFLWVN